MTRIRTDDTENIQIYIVDSSGSALTGLSDVYVRILRDSDGYLLDWNDDTFKASSWTTLNKALTEIDSTNAPGLYKVTGGLDTSAITNASADDIYTVIPIQTPGTSAVFQPPYEIKVGQWVDVVTDGASFGNVIYIDVDNGSSGVTETRGAYFDPVNNMADALTISANKGIKNFHVFGYLSLSGTITNCSFFGEGSQATTINLNNIPFTNTKFENMTLSGTCSASSYVYAYNCLVTSAVNFQGYLVDCLLGNVITIRIGTILNVSRCTGDNAVPCEFDMNSTGILRLFDCTAGIKISDLSSGTVYIYGIHSIELASTVTGGTVYIYGSGILTDNSTGATIYNYLDANTSISSENFVIFNPTYDPSTYAIDATFWLVRGNTIVTAPTACTLTWRKPDGTTLFSYANTDAEITGPDANGYYRLQVTQALEQDSPYTTEVSITDAIGSITTRFGNPTLG